MEKQRTPVASVRQLAHVLQADDAKLVADCTISGSELGNEAVMRAPCLSLTSNVPYVVGTTHAFLESAHPEVAGRAHPAIAIPCASIFVYQ